MASHQRDCACVRGPNLSLLEVQEVPLRAERGDKEPISSDVTGGVAPSHPEGTVAQLANLQVSGAHHPHFDYRHKQTQILEREKEIYNISSWCNNESVK